MHPYARFGATLSVSLILMFLLTMSMVVSLDHVYLNLSNFYMALIMVAPMGVVMLLSMRGMFPDQRRNVVLLAGFVALFFGALYLGRSATFVGDRQFLESMIPHHSRAILMCEESDLTDPQVQDLCIRIIDAQEREISEMEDILSRIDPP